jgi:hypothetical protein
MQRQLFYFARLTKSDQEVKEKFFFHINIQGIPFDGRTQFFCFESLLFIVHTIGVHAEFLIITIDSGENVG